MFHRHEKKFPTEGSDNKTSETYNCAQKYDGSVCGDEGAYGFLPIHIMKGQEGKYETDGEGGDDAQPAKRAPYHVIPLSRPFALAAPSRFQADRRTMDRIRPHHRKASARAKLDSSKMQARRPRTMAGVYSHIAAGPFPCGHLGSAIDLISWRHHLMWRVA